MISVGFLFIQNLSDSSFVVSVSRLVSEARLSSESLRTRIAQSHCRFSDAPFVRRRNRRNPVLLCRGRAKLGDDHPHTLNCLNNMAFVVKTQGRLAEAEALYREALKKSLGAQLQRFQDFGQWIWSHTLLDFCWLNSFCDVGNWCMQSSLHIFDFVLAKNFQNCVQSKSWQMPCKLQSVLISVLVTLDDAQRALMAKESATVQKESKITGVCDSIRFMAIVGFQLQSVQSRLAVPR